MSCLFVVVVVVVVVCCDVSSITPPQLEVNRVDFEQERSDRASAAGRYADEEQQLKKTIKITGEELWRKTEEVLVISYYVLTYVRI